MPFNPVSPGVYTQEFNLSTTVPITSSTVCAMAGLFNWGPMFVPTLVTSEADLVNKFWKPTNNNAETWFSAKAPFDYGATNLLVVRTAYQGAISNSTVNTSPNTVLTALAFRGTGNTPNNYLLLTNATYNETTFSAAQNTGTFGTVANAIFSARYPGSLGNSLKVAQCASSNQYHNVISLSGTITGGGSSGNSYNGAITFVPGSRQALMVFSITAGSNIAAGNTFANTLIQSFGQGDVFKVSTGNRAAPTQYLNVVGYSNAVTNATNTAITVTFASPYNGGSNLSVNAISRYWQYYKQASFANNQFISAWQANSAAPTVPDLMQIVVVDQNGVISGVPNTILEIFQNVSRATDAQNPDGSSNFYQNVINQKSKWIRALNDVAEYPSATANALTVVVPASAPYNHVLTGGQDGDSELVAPMQTFINGWQYFQSRDTTTIDLVIAGRATGSTGIAGDAGATYNNFGMADWLINNIAESRSDCVVFFSPDKNLVVNSPNDIATDIANWASLITPSSRAFLDSGYKYVYDKYNGLYRWVPLNGDVVGTTVYNDNVGYPWTSPAGFNRGQIKNVTRLAWNPTQGDRDFLYPLAVNPVVSFPGLGTVLYGDATFTQQPSAFNRINVRRLFLYIERAIAIAARYTLFELNDVFTQNQFKNMVTPYLARIQGLNGIQQFQVITDSTVNTPAVVNSNQFLCAILIQPTMVIDSIIINYYATPSGVTFTTAIANMLGSGS